MSIRNTTRYLKSLQELKDQKLLNFSNSNFGGWYSSEDINYAGNNELFLKRIKITSSGDLELIVETKIKNELSGYIRSNNKKMLREIKNVLESMIGKTVSEIYHNKIVVNLPITV